MELELSGHFFTLFLAMEKHKESYDPGFGLEFSTSRFRYEGQGSITREHGERIDERFLFLTEEFTENLRDPLLFLFLPSGFDEHMGWTTEEIKKKIRQSPPKKLIDVLAAKLLDEIDSWRRSELALKGHARRVLIPTLELRRPTRDIIERGFGRKLPAARPED